MSLELVSSDWSAEPEEELAFRVVPMRSLDLDLISGYPPIRGDIDEIPDTGPDTDTAEDCVEPPPDPPSTSEDCI